MSDDLILSGIGKRFGETSVLRDISLRFAPGTVTAVVGENGAGKSTLMKIVAGLYPEGSYDGRIRLGERELAFGGVADAERAGVVLVPQELHVVPHLPIRDNVFAGHELSRFGIVRTAEMDRLTREYAGVFGLRVNPGEPASSLSPSGRRMLMLAAALRKQARVLILDEPTAALAEDEATTLLERIKLLRDTGLTILYITHRLDELDGLADEIVVLRNGDHAATLPAGAPRPEIVRAMVGRDLEALTAAALDADAGSPGAMVLSLSGFGACQGRDWSRPRVRDVNLTVREGEILGLYGLVGAGRTELAQALFGIWAGSVTGQVRMLGHDRRPRSPDEAFAWGAALLAEDRKSQGILPGMSVSSNISSSSLARVSRLGVISGRERSMNRTLMDEVGVRPPIPEKAIDQLSGGNQQKVLLARCIASGVRLLILDEPTLGVDVGARVEIYRLIRRLARRDRVAILLISSDVEEVLSETDRIHVLYKGRITATFGADRDRHALLTAATSG